MVEPSDFGLSPAATLAHIGDPARSPRHAAFWKTWSAAVFEVPAPRLIERTHKDEDASDLSATHQFESVRHIRIGTALALPNGRAKAALVTLHGYGDVPSLAQSLAAGQPLVERGVAVLAVRIRGYPGSRLDTPHLSAASDEKGGGAWMTCGLTEPLSSAGIGSEWSFAYAVADVVNAVRALRTHLDNCHISLHGESFGGALATTAAAVLADHQEIARLAIGVPSMGDWPWRLSGPPEAFRCGIGSGRLIRQCIEDHPDLAPEILHTLRVLDTAVLARRVRCPVLCKLALRDEMVPAPAAAAVFNSLATDPARKWRHVTRYGHFDGGIADLRRHAAFDKLLIAFLDPAREPEETMLVADQAPLATRSAAGPILS
jgi:cephalosporin-C deacetylase-like acetyl esterase